MSKLIRAVEAKLLHKQRLSPLIKTPVLLEVTNEIDARSSTPLQVAYKIEAKFGARGFCSAEDLPALKRNVVSELKHEMYGEIIEVFLQLERALYEQALVDHDVKALLNRIRREIY